jgi:hypothetical protein
MTSVTLAQLVKTWRILPDSSASAPKTPRKLVLDGVNLAFLSLLVHGLCHPEYTEITDMWNAILVHNIFLSASGCSEETWIRATEHAKSVILVPRVTLKMQAKTSQTSQPGKVLPTSQDADASRDISDVSTNVSTNISPALPGFLPRPYTNVKRELTRYMWQPEDYICRNCNTTWPKHTVTISWRQTCVSECLKGKKSCTSRDVFRRAQDGELFITDRHDLSPPPDQVLAAEAQGKMVAVDPATGNLTHWDRHI